jgi:hypothetical protein
MLVVKAATASLRLHLSVSTIGFFATPCAEESRAAISENQLMEVMKMIQEGVGSPPPSSVTACRTGTTLACHAMETRRSSWVSTVSAPGRPAASPGCPH